MKLIKVISCALAVMSIAAISTTVFAESGIITTYGEKGAVTYSFTEDITSVGEHTSSDSALVVHIREIDKNTMNTTKFSDGSLNLGRYDKASASGLAVRRAPEEAGDYIVYTADTDGVLTGDLNAISWFKNISADLNSCEQYGYGDSNKFSIEVAKGDVIELGARVDSSSISSITFTPNAYNESYTFDIKADELSDKTLFVGYNENNFAKTNEKKLSELLGTQVTGEGDVKLCGITITDIPENVSITSVVIK